MTDPKEINEEINEELSTEELKSVSGGIINGTKDFDSQIQGSGSGKTLDEWKKSRGDGFDQDLNDMVMR